MRLDVRPRSGNYATTEQHKVFVAFLCDFNSAVKDLWPIWHGWHGADIREGERVRVVPTNVFNEILRSICCDAAGPPKTRFTTCGKWLKGRRWKEKRWLCNSIARSSAIMSSTLLSYVAQANTYETAQRQRKPLEKHPAPKQLYWKLLCNVFAGFSKRYGIQLAPRT